jgi:hypothetical protein
MHISHLRSIYRRAFGKEMPTPMKSVKAMQDQGLPLLADLTCIRAKDPASGKTCLSFSGGNREEAKIFRFDSELQLISESAQTRPAREGQAGFFGRGHDPRDDTGRFE